jgi:hypothetical protein
MAFFIVTAVKISNLTIRNIFQIEEYSLLGCNTKHSGDSEHFGETHLQLKD